MSMDPSLHSKQQKGTLSQHYGAHRVTPQAEGAIFGAAIGDDRKPAEIMKGVDGTLKLRPRGLGV